MKYCVTSRGSHMNEIIFHFSSDTIEHLKANIYDVIIEYRHHTFENVFENLSYKCGTVRPAAAAI